MIWIWFLWSYRWVWSNMLWISSELIAARWYVGSAGEGGYWTGQACPNVTCCLVLCSSCLWRLRETRVFVSSSEICTSDHINISASEDSGGCCRLTTQSLETVLVLRRYLFNRLDKRTFFHFNVCLGGLNSLLPTAVPITRVKHTLTNTHHI